MSETLADIAVSPPFPDHTQLPESDGTFVSQFGQRGFPPLSELARKIFKSIPVSYRSFDVN